MTLKKRERSRRTLPRMKSTPNQTARARPAREPSSVTRPLVVKETAARKRAVSIPSRKTMRKVKRKRPAKTAGELPRSTIFARVPFISRETSLAWRHIQMTMEVTMAAEVK